MKANTRILAMLLALLMCLTLFAACNKEEETNDGGQTLGSTETATEEAVKGYEFNPKIPEKNYDTEFILSIMTRSNRFAWHWVEEGKSDAMSESIYARQEAVRKHLGVEVLGKTEGNGYDHTTYTEEYKTAIKNKDDSLHMMITHVHGGVGNLITGNYVRNLANVEGLNVEDADYWSWDMMDDISINGKMYLGNNSFNILSTYVIAFNKDMMEQYEDSMGTTVYELVDNYKWTLDQMINLASQVSIDTNSDGKTEDDTYGLTGTQWVEFIGFLNASNIQLIEQNEENGLYEVSFYNDKNAEKTTALAEKLKNFVTSSNAWFRYRIETTPLIGLETGRALMNLRNTGALPDLCNSEDLDFGILPYPMYDEEQADVGYRHLQWGGFTVMPSYVADPTMVAETIELLAYYSYDVNNTFYEKLLGKQAADAPDDRRMLEIVWNTICSDIAQPYSEIADVLYMLPVVTSYAATESVSSYHAAREKNVNKSFVKFVKSINKLKD